MTAPTLNIRKNDDLNQTAREHATQFGGQRVEIEKQTKDKYLVKLEDGTVIARARSKTQAETYVAMIPAKAPKAPKEPAGPATAYGRAKQAWERDGVVAKPEDCWYAPTGGKRFSAVQTLHVILAAATQELQAVTIAEALEVLGDEAVNSHPETTRKLAGPDREKLLMPFGWTGERSGVRGAYAYAIAPLAEPGFDLVAHAEELFPGVQARIEAVAAARVEAAKADEPAAETEVTEAASA